MSNSMAVAKRSSDSDLMPPPPVKRMKRPPKVLSEEEYTADLDYIIARDYFPGLLEADAQQDYLNALDAGDKDWMEEAGQRVKAIMTPREPGRRGVSITPKRNGLDGLGDSRSPTRWGVDKTPSGMASSNEKTSTQTERDQREAARVNMSLSSYQATFSSEDNASFATIIDNQNEKRREKYRWLWSGTNKLPSKQQLAQRQLENKKEKTKAIEAPEYFSARYTGSPSSSTALIKAEGAKPSLDSRERPAAVDRIPHQPRNGLFFNPDDMTLTHPGLPSEAESAAQRSKAGPKAVSHANTRIWLNADGFAVTDEEEEGRPSSPTMSAVDAALRGRPHPDLSRGGAYADSEAGGPEDGSETPMVDGWKFVDADVPVESRPPSPPPERRKAKKEVDHDALFTSLIQSSGGEDGEETSSNPFNIAAQSKRENLHHAMVEKQNQAKRAKNDRMTALKGQHIGETPRFMSSPRVGAMPKAGMTPGASKKGTGGLTPAGQALYNKIGGATPRRSGGQATPFGGKMTATPMRTPLRARGV